MAAIPRRLEGRVAVVTASTQGIGFSIAERLGLEGASVVISSRKQVAVSLVQFFFSRPIMFVIGYEVKFL
jgi:NAD(P)-dependent dehydrogenase (short-subunit alcohol dehydrogenase family)